MRGETEADETLGAQRLKSQYGSVRVRDKKDELIRLSRDAARISGEIICDNFTQKELLEISQMDIPTRREVDKRSEEHTSELQSLMRISYAVFCLKKKTNTPNSYLKKTLT